MRGEPRQAASVGVELTAGRVEFMDDLASRTYPFQEDMAFQQRWWRAERIGWIAMALVLAAALTGVFFHGPASHTIARSADGDLTVEYERFAHKTALTHFIIRVSPPLPEQEQVLIRLSPAFANTHDIDSLAPRPVRSSGGSYGLELVFARSAAGDLAIYMAARPKRFGLLSVHVEAEGRGAINIAQLIYP